MPTIYIEQDGLHIEINTTRISWEIVIVRTRVEIEYHGANVVLRDQTVVHHIDGELANLIGPEN